MTDIFTEGKIKPAIQDGKVADFTDIDGEVEESQLAAAARLGLVAHHDGVGPPTTAPTRAGQFSIDNEGSAYASGDEIINIATHPTITTHQVGPGQNEWALWRGAGIDGSLTR